MAVQKVMKFGFMPVVSKNAETGKTIYTLREKDLRMADVFSTALNVKYEVVLAKDGLFGGMLPNGSFSGTIGLLEREEADVVMTDLGVTAERQTVAHFSYAYTFGGFVFATKTPQYSPRFLALVNPFSLELWIVVCFYVLLMCMVFYVVLRKSQSFQKVAINTFQSFLFQNFLFEPQRDSGRVLMISWCFGCMFITSGYTAVMLSFLTLPSRERGIRTIPELSEAVRKKQYISSTFKGNYIPFVLSNSDDPMLRVIGEDVGNHLIDVSETKFLLLHSDEKVALIVPRNYLDFLAGRCFISEDTFFGIVLAVPYKKSFCCAEELGKASLRIAAAGLYFKITSDMAFLEFLHNLTPAEKIQEEPNTVLNLKDMSGAFCVLVIGYTLSAGAFLWELATNKTKLAAAAAENVT